jgi:zinc protease
VWRSASYGFSEIRTEASVKAMTAPVTAFWRQNFVASNAALVVAGDISMAELRAGGSRSGRSGAERRRGRRCPRRRRFHRAWSSLTSLAPANAAARVATIGAARSSPDFRPIRVMNLALGGSFASRISEPA